MPALTIAICNILVFVFLCVCNKLLLKYKGDRESFWHGHQKGVEIVPPILVFESY